eukprot:TRINITY_DN27044_c0_g2_i1.p1 TRINITY_DN27044_c0_g2~~TRINITY_DN27044_c0_g2_i1.p1  ORF type:complete len:275 (-),score=17.63 TRINITY_DN27044_c0_g2_i1:12-809(-)
MDCEEVRDSSVGLDVRSEASSTHSLALASHSQQRAQSFECNVHARRLCTSVTYVETTRSLLPALPRRHKQPFNDVMIAMNKQVLAHDRLVYRLTDAPATESLQAQEEALNRHLPGARYVPQHDPHENGFYGRTFYLFGSGPEKRRIRQDLCEALGLSDEFYRRTTLFESDLDELPFAGVATTLRAFGDTFSLSFGRLDQDNLRSGSMACWLAYSRTEFASLGRPILGVFGCLGPLTPASSASSSPERNNGNGCDMHGWLDCPVCR